MSKTQILSAENFHVGIICALSHEMAAMIGMFDQEYEGVEWKSKTDDNSYTVGRINEHNVVIACLPMGNTGISPATTVIEQMQITFANLRFCLLVGTGGGIPSHKNDIRLGDVVVSVPEGVYGGVVQHDMGKNHEGGNFEYRGFLNRPPRALLTALSLLKARSLLKINPMRDYLIELNKKYDCFLYPGKAKDILFCSNCEIMRDRSSCTVCTDGKISNARSDPYPKIHFGTIVSGNQEVASARKRDELSNHFKAKCIESIAAGIMNNFPCVTIRGICNYADSHEYSNWQNYPAAVAAAFTKWLLSYVTPHQPADEQGIYDVTGTLKLEARKSSSGRQIF